MRGEHQELDSRLIASGGSAPRARGTLGVATGQARQHRISPACAGNTRCAATSWPSSADQPRVRGEHCASSAPGRASVGSAPRARGTPAACERPRDRRRISPACAGNTQPSSRATQANSDQPRVRGEHLPVSRCLSTVPGSAPRARGTYLADPCTHAGDRISPACAGNTAAPPSTTCTRSDQPRRARGTRLQHVLLVGLRRISPACAGNTVSLPGARVVVADQPRVRGEHTRAPPDAVAPAGSAPRARGTLVDVAEVLAGVRISPACAGNTRRPRRGRWTPTDQPRVRGEHPLHLADVLIRRRISPACAGNT